MPSTFILDGLASVDAYLAADTTVERCAGGLALTHACAARIATDPARGSDPRGAALPGRNCHPRHPQEVKAMYSEWQLAVSPAPPPPDTDGERSTVLSRLLEELELAEEKSPGEIICAPTRQNNST